MSKHSSRLPVTSASSSIHAHDFGARREATAWRMAFLEYQPTRSLRTARAASFLDAAHYKEQSNTRPPHESAAAWQYSMSPGCQSPGGPGTIISGILFPDAKYALIHGRMKAWRGETTTLRSSLCIFCRPICPLMPIFYQIFGFLWLPLSRRGLLIPQELPLLSRHREPRSERLRRWS